MYWISLQYIHSTVLGELVLRLTAMPPSEYHRTYTERNWAWHSYVLASALFVSVAWLGKAAKCMLAITFVLRVSHRA